MADHGHRTGRREKIVPFVGVIAVLMRKESVLSLYTGTGAFL